jgi:hypothetical protein
MTEIQSRECDDVFVALTGVSSARPSDIKTVIMELLCDPKPSLFWILSKLIRLAAPDDLLRTKGSLLDIIAKHQHRFLGASFCLLRLARRWDDFPVSSVSILTNPHFAVTFLTTFESCFDLAALWGLLDYPDDRIQRSAASVLARRSADRQTLAAETLDRLAEAKSGGSDVHVSGLIEILQFCTDIDVPVSHYIRALTPVFQDERLSRSSRSAQRLLGKLLSSNPATFHAVDLLDAAAMQFVRGWLDPAFFDAVLRSYGLHAIRKFCVRVLPQLIEAFDAGGRRYIASLVP